MPIDLPPVSVPSLQQSLPVEEIALLESWPGETRSAFIQRAAEALDVFTQENQYEGCSRLWVSPEGNRWGVGLVSNQSHIGCTLLDKAPFEGLVATQESIHSHPTVERYRVNRQDRIFQGMKSRLNQVKSVEGSRFSDADFKSGPGYMVHDGKLYHQAGGGTLADLGPLPLPDENSRAAQALPRQLASRLRDRRLEREAQMIAAAPDPDVSEALSQVSPSPQAPRHRH